MTAERNNPNIPNVVQANTFQLVDDNGAVRGLFTTDQSGQPYLGLYDHTDTPRLEARLLGESGQPRLSLSNERGEYRLLADVYPTGQPTLALTDQSGSIRLMAFLGPTGEPVLNMLDQNQELRISISVGLDGEPHVTLTDQDGELRFV